MDAPMAETVYSPTANKILTTARKLFMQRGYRAVSINDIVQAAEITKPTLYYHFSDKEELYVQMALHTLAQMHAQMEAAIAGRDAIGERLAALAGVITSTSDGDTRMMRHEIREHLNPTQQRRIGQAFEQHMVAPLTDVMRQGMERGELRGHTAQELAWLFLGFMEGFHRGPEADPNSMGLAQQPASFPTDTLIDLFLHGVAGRGAGR